MVRRWIAALVGLCATLVLAGCGDKGLPDVAINEVALNAIASSGPTIAERLAQGNDSGPARPAPTGFDHLGRWARTPALCPTDPWRFAADQVETDGETRCRVTRTETVSDSATKLTLECMNGRLKTIQSWSLVRREDGSMTVARTEGGNGVPRSVTLTRCG